MHPAKVSGWLFRLSLALTLALAAAAPAEATDYYVSVSGLDSNDGHAPSRAWRTINRVNNQRLLPGDRVLFEGGVTFSGNLYLDEWDAGRPDAPVTIGSYGSGRATIYAGDGTGILAYNTAGIRIRDLYVVGSGRDINTGRGVFFFVDLPGDVKLDFIEIDHVDAVRFGDYGVLIGADAGSSGFRNVRIAHVVASENRMGGIFTYAQVPNTHENVYVGSSTAAFNSGFEGLLYNSGNGITLSGVNGGTIERSVAHGNGWRSDAGNGPIGIWAFDSTRMLIQFNESYGNRTGGTKDGGGFCFDQNTSHSVMQYNYSHDNDGAGYLLAHKPDNRVHAHNVVRYNVTANDARRNDYASIHTWGRILDAEIHNNTIYVTSHSSTIPGVPRAIFIKNSSITLQDPERLHFRNNIIQTTSGLRLIEASASVLDAGIDIRFEGNNYWPTGGTFRVTWGSTTYTSLAAWRSATGQERRSGADVGMSVDPRHLRPTQIDSFNDAYMIGGLWGFRLKADSQLIDTGLDLAALGVGPGPRDYFGGATRVNGKLDVGAHEFVSTCHWALSPSSVTAPADAVSGTLSVTAADPSCGWSALSSASWLGTTYATRTGSGNGSISYWALANTGSAERSGTIRIAGQPFTITQAGTGGIEPPPPPPSPDEPGEIVLHAATGPALRGGWSIVADSTAASGARVQSTNAGAAKVTTAAADPAHTVELTFNAEAGKGYRLWVRGKAISNSYANDSVHVQFSGSVNASGAAVWRIGTTSSTAVNIEDCSGCGLAAWGWQDNGYGTGVLGPLVYFAATGPQTIRLQPREDGLGIDQVVLSTTKYLSSAPGALKNDATILTPAGGSDDGGEPPPPPPPPPGTGDVVLYAAEATTVVGSWGVVSDATAAGGARLQNPNAGAAKVTTAAASPASYFEMTFTAEAGRGYRLWLRGKATSNAWSNDSVHVQFSGSRTAAGAAAYRIGTSSSAEVNIEDCSGCGLSGWGWQDNGYGAGVLGPEIFFDAGAQTIRIQHREDGLGIDQIVLSPSTYLTTSPGALKNDAVIVAK